MRMNLFNELTERIAANDAEYAFAVRRSVLRNELDLTGDESALVLELVRERLRELRAERIEAMREQINTKGYYATP